MEVVRLCGLEICGLNSELHTYYRKITNNYYTKPNPNYKKMNQRRPRTPKPIIARKKRGKGRCFAGDLIGLGFYAQLSQEGSGWVQIKIKDRG